jgi:hypothetical protein
MFLASLARRISTSSGATPDERELLDLSEPAHHRQSTCESATARQSHGLLDAGDARRRRERGQAGPHQHLLQAAPGERSGLRRVRPVHPVPNGLRYAFGYDMKTGLGGVTDPTSPVSSMVKWTCNKDDAGNAAIPGSFHTLAEMVAAGCPAGAKIFLMFVAPDCWDGNVAAADHRSNMSYPTRATPNGFRCPPITLIGRRTIAASSRGRRTPISSPANGISRATRWCPVQQPARRSISIIGKPGRRS